MPTSPPSMTAAPTAPDRGDRATFSARATAFADYLKDDLIPDITAALANVFANATSAYNDAVIAAAAALSASASASAAALSAGAALWVSGTTYSTVGTRVISPANGCIYRRLIAGAGTTDPSADATNWALVLIDMPIVECPATSQNATPNAYNNLTNAAASLLTLNASPVDGERCTVICGNGRVDNTIDTGSKVVLGTNGQTASGVILLNAGGAMSLKFFNSINKWVAL